MSFIIRHQLTDVAAEDLLIVIITLFPSTMLSSTKYVFFKQFSENMPTLEKRFFGDKCNILLEPSQEINDNDEEFIPSNEKNNRKKMKCMCCPACSKYFKEDVLLQSNQFFITLSLKRQLENLISSSLYEKISSYQSEIRRGTYCKKLEENMQQFSKDDLTLQFNTDGLNPFKSSKNSVWPILVCVNELPYVLRRKNITLCGLWFNSKKPDIDLFLSSFVEELQALHRDGIMVKQSSGEFKQVRVHGVKFCRFGCPANNTKYTSV